MTQDDKELEQMVQIEIVAKPLPNGESAITLRGMPIHIIFAEPLPIETFHKMMDDTFEKNQGLGLWGNPIYFGEKRDAAHLYGLDLKTWKQVDGEFTTEYIMLILRKGAPFDVVRRVIQALKQYGQVAEVWAGDMKLGSEILEGSAKLE